MSLFGQSALWQIWLRARQNPEEVREALSRLGVRYIVCLLPPILLLDLAAVCLMEFQSATDRVTGKVIRTLQRAELGLAKYDKS